MGTRFFVDGVRVEEAAFVVSGNDEGLLVGLNVFETMRTYAGRIFRIEGHLARLLDSARAVGVPHPGAEALRAELREAVRGLDDEMRLRLTLTVGGRRLLHVTPLQHAMVGASLRVATLEWEPPVWLGGRIKHGSRALGEVARRRLGVDELLWVGRDGCLTEGTRSSIFAALDGVLVTPPMDGRILEGITRQALLDAARHAGIQVLEARLPRDAALTELYATSTLKEMAPVREMDGKPAPGKGPLGERLGAAFRDLVVKECGGAA